MPAYQTPKTTSLKLSLFLVMALITPSFKSRILTKENLQALRSSFPNSHVLNNAKRHKSISISLVDGDQTQRTNGLDQVSILLHTEPEEKGLFRNKNTSLKIDNLALTQDHSQMNPKSRISKDQYINSILGDKSSQIQNNNSYRMQSESAYIFREKGKSQHQLLNQNGGLICKTDLVASYVLPNFDLVKEMHEENWWPEQETLYKMREQVSRIENSKEYILHMRARTTATPNQEIDELADAKPEINEPEEERDNINFNTIQYISEAVPPSPELSEICPKMEQSCCTDTQFLKLYMTFSGMKDLLLWHVRAFEKISQALEIISLEDLDLVFEMLDRFEQSNTTFNLQKAMHMDGQISLDLLQKMLLLLKTEVGSHLKQFKRAMQTLLSYYSGFACALCSQNAHRFFDSMAKFKMTKQGETTKYNQNYKSRESMIKYDVDTCQHFTPLLSESLDVMIFLRKLAIFGRLVEIAVVVKKNIQKQEVERRRSDPSLIKNDLNLKDSKYENLKDISHWRVMQQISLTCGEDKNYILEKCANLCRRVLGITRGTYFPETFRIIESVLPDIVEMFFTRADFFLNGENPVFDLNKLNSHFKDTLDQAAPRVITTENSVDILDSDTVYSKISNLLDQKQYFENSGSIMFFYLSCNLSNYNYDRDHYVEYRENDGINLFKFSMNPKFYTHFMILASHGIWDSVIAAVGVLLILINF